jgi:hypothetical protein
MLEHQPSAPPTPAGPEPHEEENAHDDPPQP